MPRTKRPPINYTSRDFNSIKSDLVNYAKVYYPTTFKDFQEAGFGSLMLDNISYIGDILSFYLDYQFNETFIDTAVEFRNVNRIARQSGVKYTPSRSATGILSFFINVPSFGNTGAAGDDAAPDVNYLPVLRKGSTFSTSAGKVYTLVEDVDFSNANFQTTVNNVNPSTGAPTSFIVKGFGKVISGRKQTITKTLGDFLPFRKVLIRVPNITEILSVVDSEGREYYQVDNLSEDVVYRKVPNRGTDSSQVPFVMKPVAAARRFEVIHEDGATYLQFGYGSEEELDVDGNVVDPTLKMLQMDGKEYFAQQAFDPKRLLSSGRMGVSPSNTTLTITFRHNTGNDMNTSVGNITKVVSPSFVFPDLTTLNTSFVTSVRNSLEVTNEEAITGDGRLISAEEMRLLSKASFNAQKRAVTAEDYKALIYTMPSNFGSVKRVAVYRDAKELKNNINIYLISENSSGQLQATSTTLRENIKNYIQDYKLVSDTIDLFNASIINFGLNITVISEPQVDVDRLRQTIMARMTSALATKPQIGENFVISYFTNIINQIDGVADVLRFKVVRRLGDNYAQTRFSIAENTSATGNEIYIPKNGIYEIKYPNIDIGLEVR